MLSSAYIDIQLQLSVVNQNALDGLACAMLDSAAEFHVRQRSVMCAAPHLYITSALPLGELCWHSFRAHLARIKALPTAGAVLVQDGAAGGSCAGRRGGARKTGRRAHYIYTKSQICALPQVLFWYQAAPAAALAVAAAVALLGATSTTYTSNHKSVLCRRCCFDSRRRGLIYLGFRPNLP